MLAHNHWLWSNHIFDICYLCVTIIFIVYINERKIGSSHLFVRCHRQLWSSSCSTLIDELLDFDRQARTRLNAHANLISNRALSLLFLYFNLKSDYYIQIWITFHLVQSHSILNDNDEQQYKYWSFISISLNVSKSP